MDGMKRGKLCGMSMWSALPGLVLVARALARHFCVSRRRVLSLMPGRCTCLAAFQGQAPQILEVASPSSFYLDPDLGCNHAADVAMFRELAGADLFLLSRVCVGVAIGQKRDLCACMNAVVGLQGRVRVLLATSAAGTVACV